MRAKVNSILDTEKVVQMNMSDVCSDVEKVKKRIDETLKKQVSPDRIWEQRFAMYVSAMSLTASNGTMGNLQLIE